MWNRCRSILIALACLAAQACAPVASAQSSTGKPTYPNRTIRMVLPFPPGGATDVMARKLGQKMSERWGQQVVIDNRAGAGGNIAAEIVAKAVPDGYTLLFAASAQLAVNPALYAKLPFDPVKSFAPISLVGAVPNILVAHPSLPVRSLKEFIAFARARPGQLNYATAGSGSTAHLSAELLKIETGIDIVHVPYRGAAPAVTDVLGGQVPLMVVSTPSVIGHVKVGKLRALGVTGARRSHAAPDVPTFAETLPGFESSAWYGMLAPNGASPDIVARLHEETVNILRMADVKELFAAQGIEIIGSTPSEFASYIESELAKWAIVVRKSNAKVD
ncbi:MAG: tripartite tricarboxylate transporter substrate binding protein [Proteobacteria bacterium]|nr:tripartite tricarboxylate transporter substrate binding protein [Burkholderiales bacterium]